MCLKYQRIEKQNWILPVQWKTSQASTPPIPDQLTDHDQQIQQIQRMAGDERQQLKRQIPHF